MNFAHYFSPAMVARRVAASAIFAVTDVMWLAIRLSERIEKALRRDP